MLYSIKALILILIVSILGTSTYFVLNNHKKTDLVATLSSQLTYPTSCRDLKTRIDKYKQEKILPDTIGDIMYSAQPANNEVTPYYTNTNIQVSGIDESDLVKTNGTHVFVMDVPNSTIKIAKVYPINEAEKLSELTFKSANGSEELHEMFLKDASLIVLSHFRNDDKSSNVPAWYHNPYRNTVLRTYDISNPTYPKLTRRLEIEGSFTTARMRDDIVYLITTSSLGTDDKFSLPQFSDVHDGSLQNITECENITILDQSNMSQTLTTVTSLNITQPNNQPYFSSYMGNTITVYMGEESIYLVSENTIWENNPNIFRKIGILPRTPSTSASTTQITKLHYV